MAIGFAGIIGQEKLISRLRALKDLYATQSATCEHVLLIGPPGVGKRTIARAFANEIGCGFVEMSSNSLRRVGDLTSIITSLEPRDVLLIEDIHRIKEGIRALLLPALADFQIQLVIGQGPGQRIHPYKLNRFTCVATVSRQSDCTPELLEVFPVALPMDNYSDKELCRVVQSMAMSRGVSIPESVAAAIAKASGGTPRGAELQFQRLANACENEITEENALRVLSVLGGKPTLPIRDGYPDIPTSHLGTAFERLVTTLLGKMGFLAEMTKATGDGGIDIVATLHSPVLGGRYLIQCKRFAPDALVGAPALREFYGALVADRKAIKGIFITTARFSDQALEFARDLRIELIDGAKLRSLLTEYGIDEENSLVGKPQDPLF